MTWAVHRLDRELALVDFREIHALAIVFVVPAGFPELHVENLRRDDFVIAVRNVEVAHVLNEAIVNDRSFWMEERARRRFRNEAEKVELFAELAMVALLRFVQNGEVLCELGLGLECRAVNTLKLWILRLAAPVGARNAHQFHCFDIVRVLDVRAAAEVQEVAFLISGHGRGAIGSQRVDDLELERLVHLREDFFRFRDRVLFARKRLVGLDDLGHLFFDLRKIFRSQLHIEFDVVIEAVLNGRADAELGLRPETRNRMRHHVRSRVAHRFEV